jgi:hypothetical protein
MTDHDLTAEGSMALAHMCALPPLERVKVLAVLQPIPMHLSFVLGIPVCGGTALTSDPSQVTCIDCLAIYQKMGVCDVW